MKIIRDRKDLITQIIKEPEDDVNVDVTQVIIANEKEYTERYKKKQEKTITVVKEITSFLKCEDLPPCDEMNLDFSEAGQEQ